MSDYRPEVVAAFVRARQHPYLDDERDRLMDAANLLAGDGLSEREYRAIGLAEINWLRGRRLA